MSRRQVLVSVAALCVLTCAGLLFPAVQKVRDAAARMNCHCHLGQLAFCIHNYAAANGEEFPQGAAWHLLLSPEERLSWIVPALPYIEQDDVFKQFDLSRGLADPQNVTAANNRISHLTCPASGEYDRNTRQWKSPTPVTHYVGVSGVGADTATLPLKHPRAGIFGYDRRTSLKDGIPDGTSNTLLIIETADEPGHWAFGGRATVRGFESDTAPYLGPGRPFGGFHNGGPVLLGSRTHTCTAALADGSVRSLSSAITPKVLEALATVGGKEELPANW